MGDERPTGSDADAQLDTDENLQIIDGCNRQSPIKNI